MFLSGSRRFSVVLVGSRCSRRVSMVISGSHRFSMFLCASWCFNDENQQQPLRNIESLREHWERTRTTENL